MKYNVRFIPEGRTVALEAGATLLDAQIAADLSTDAPCGGKGTCGKCAVQYRPVGDSAWRVALACQTRVDGDMEVHRLRDGERLQVLTEGIGSGAGAWDPMVRTLRLHVEPCARGESTADWTRLCAALAAETGRSEWRLSLSACRELGRLLAQTKGDVWAVVCGEWVLDVRAEKPRAFMAAFDLGTTSIAGYLIDCDGGAVAATAGMANPQARYGGDVISRADCALANGAQPLADCAREAIDALARRMCAEAGVDVSQVYAVMMAGNTAMHHLFLGISPDSLVRAPYNPVLSGPVDVEAASCAVRVHPAARLYFLPVIGGFVGADTVACLLSGGWRTRRRRTLMIDIGTNGELVLGDCHRRLACSTAAGPALEGAKITCGMRAADGAVDRVWLEGETLRWHVIGDGLARGICGSGLVDLVAALLACGALDEGGRLEDDRFDIGDTGVYLTQKDVREVQLAKAAIAAGIRLMARRLGVALESIEEVDIAGAFGNYIDPDSACAIGLIPAELRRKIVPVGNAAGEGAKLALMDASVWNTAETLARETEFLELATLPEFQDEFVDQLSFSDEED